MSHQVTIASGKKDVVLPNGVRYQAGQSAVLSDMQYSLLTASFKSAFLSADTSSGASLDTTSSDIALLGQQTAGSVGKAADAGHIHPLHEPLAEDFGYLAWAYDPIQIQAGQSPTSGVIWLTRIPVRRQITVTNIVIEATGTAGGLTSGENFLGIYNSSGTQIGVTADQTTAWGTSGTKTAALSGGATSLAPGFYYVAFLNNYSSASPGFGRTGSSPHSGSVNGTNSAATSRSATNGSGTTLPGSLTLSSNSAQAVQLWAAFT